MSRGFSIRYMYAMIPPVPRHPSPSMGSRSPAMLELAEIFRRHGPAYRAKFADRMPKSHLEAMKAIEQCRTEALGGHVSQCTKCGDLEYSDHSCKNRHCPKCQNAAATQWLEQQ